MKEPFIFKLVPYFIGFVFFLIVANFGFFGYIVSKVSQDGFTGVKPIIEKVWCGSPGCTDK